MPVFCAIVFRFLMEMQYTPIIFCTLFSCLLQFFKGRFKFYLRLKCIIQSPQMHLQLSLMFAIKMSLSQMKFLLMSSGAEYFRTDKNKLQSSQLFASSQIGFMVNNANLKPLTSLPYLMDFPPRVISLYQQGYVS